MTHRALPSRPSHYVSMILQPLQQFLQVGGWVGGCLIAGGWAAFGVWG